MTISAEQIEKYRQLRVERGLSQNEARRIIGVGRTKSWELDRELGLTGEQVEKQRRRPVPRKTRLAGGGSDLRQRLERDEAAGVIPPGVAESFGHEPGTGPPKPPELVIPDRADRAGEVAPRRGDLLFFQGERGTLPMREETPKDDAFSIPTSDYPGAPVRVRVGRESPSDIEKFARLSSHR